MDRITKHGFRLLMKCPKRYSLSNLDGDAPMTDERAMSVMFTNAALRMSSGAVVSKRDMYKVFSRTRGISLDNMDPRLAKRYVRYVDQAADWLSSLGRSLVAGHPYNIDVDGISYVGEIELVCRPMQRYFVGASQKHLTRSSPTKVALVQLRGHNPDKDVDVSYILDSFAYRLLFSMKSPEFPTESEIYIYNYKSGNVTVCEVGTGDEATARYKRARRILRDEAKWIKDGAHRAIGDWCKQCPVRVICSK